MAFAGCRPKADCQEPTLEELMGEPIIQLLMAADGVSRRELELIVAGVNAQRSDQKMRNTQTWG